MASPLEALVELLSSFPAGRELPPTAGQAPIQGPRQQPISTGIPTGEPSVLGQLLGITQAPQQTQLSGGISTAVRQPTQQPAQTPQQTPQPNRREQFVQQKGQETSQLAEPQTGIVGIPTQKTPEQEAEDDKARAEFIAEMVRIGVPLGAAIAGTVAPGILPQTAGLSTGFSDEVSRQRAAQAEAAEEEELVDVQIIENGQLKKVGKAKKKDIVKTANQGFQLPEIDVPQQQIGDAVKGAKEKIRVINLETNQRGTIEADEFDPAKFQKI